MLSTHSSQQGVFLHELQCLYSMQSIPTARHHPTRVWSVPSDAYCTTHFSGSQTFCLELSYSRARFLCVFFPGRLVFRFSPLRTSPASFSPSNFFLLFSILLCLFRLDDFLCLSVLSRTLFVSIGRPVFFSYVSFFNLSRPHLS